VAALQANWSTDFTSEWLSSLIEHFRSQMQWLQEASPKRVLSKAERLALVGLSENGNPRGENCDERRQRIQQEEEKERQQFESDPAHIAEIRAKAEELSKTAVVGNHSANESFRRVLSETYAYDATGKVNWFESYRLRKEAYKQKTQGW
jgi:hypothetical protein